MPNLKISQLSNGGALQSTDQVPVARGGNNYKILGSEFLKTSVQEIPSGAIDGSNTDFDLSNAPEGGTLDVFLNGVFLTENEDYTFSGVTITLVAPPVSGDRLTVTYQY